MGGIDLFHALYRPLLFDALAARAGDAEHLAALLAEHGEEVAAVIVEPLVQGAAGMLMQPPAICAEVRELCDGHGVLLICDEVATGFGRTGRMFACEHEDVVPDLMCVAKGLTGGYLPLAATLTTERIYEGFLGRLEEYRTFFHGHTYTGNPLACAAALATLEVFERERTLERAARRDRSCCTELLEPSVAPLAGVAEVRQRGLMVRDRAGRRPSPSALGHQVTLAARRRGAIDPPARRRGRADAGAGDARGRAAAAGRDHRRGDRRGDRADDASSPPAAGRAEVSSPRRRRSRLVLVWREIALASAAHGTEPGVGNVLESVPGGMPPSGSPSAGS